MKKEIYISAESLRNVIEIERQRGFKYQTPRLYPPKTAEESFDRNKSMIERNKKHA